MAYCKRITIKTDLKNRIKYASNPEKTDEKIFVSNYKCDDNFEIAYSMMKATKKIFNKDNDEKILGYHVMQSFKKNEISPIEAHDIGMETMKKYLEDKFEFVLATHLDKEHIHNHIIINSVSFIDGKKLNADNKNLQKLRDCSDKICKEHDKSIIVPNEKNRSLNYKEWIAKKENYSLKDLIKIDIDDSILDSKSYEDFIKIMSDKGYKLKYGNVKYNTFKHKDFQKSVRGFRLGDEYTEDEIKKRIKEKNLETEIEIREKNNFKFESFVNNSSKKELLKNLIDTIILQAEDVEDFKNMLEENNFYDITLDKEYLKVRHKDFKNIFKLSSLGEEYKLKNIDEKIKNNFIKRATFDDIKRKFFVEKNVKSDSKISKEDHIKKEKNESDNFDFYDLKNKFLKLKNDHNIEKNLFKEKDFTKQLYYENYKYVKGGVEYYAAYNKRLDKYIDTLKRFKINGNYDYLFKLTMRYKSRFESYKNDISKAEILIENYMSKGDLEQANSLINSYENLKTEYEKIEKDYKDLKEVNGFIYYKNKEKIELEKDNSDHQR